MIKDKEITLSDNSAICFSENIKQVAKQSDYGYILRAVSKTHKLELCFEKLKDIDEYFEWGNKLANLTDIDYNEYGIEFYIEKI